ncbi:MAG: hypothetical protein DLM66_08575 [Candidatus Dormiibacter spiritus]|nr:MAG: hypothetical protein DLM66_08575 [Candidatus Dormibacteraeota bacterium]
MFVSALEVGKTAGEAAHNEAVATAREAGLRYVSDSDEGIRRERRETAGDAFSPTRQQNHLRALNEAGQPTIAELGDLFGVGRPGGQSQGPAAWQAAES